MFGVECPSDESEINQGRLQHVLTCGYDGRNARDCLSLAHPIKPDCEMLSEAWERRPHFLATQELGGVLVEDLGQQLLFLLLLLQVGWWDREGSVCQPLGGVWGHSPPPRIDSTPFRKCSGSYSGEFSARIDFRGVENVLAFG